MAEVAEMVEVVEVVVRLVRLELIVLVELAGPIRLSSIIVATNPLHLARRTQASELGEDHSSQS